eukprot:s180_g5.t1
MHLMLQVFMEITTLQHLLPMALFVLQCAVCTSPAMFSAKALLAELKANEQLLDSKLPAKMKEAITNELDNLMMGHCNMANKVTTTASACDWLNKYLAKED